MQKAFINKIYELAENNSDIILLTADNGTDYDTLFERDFPEQYFNLGITEENMVAIASGMALCGKIPFICSSGAFLVYRAYEFIRNDVCFQNQNVKIVALGSGLSIGALGPTHHTTEDISCLKAIPNLQILAPASPLEVSRAMDFAIKNKEPIYLRLGMNSEKEIHEDNKFFVNKVNILREGKDTILFVTGDVVHNALKAAEILSDYLDVCIAEIISLKPLDEEGILTAIGKKSKVFTVEEHNVIGGMGADIAGVVNKNGLLSRVYKIGINDYFAKGFGTQAMIQKHNGLGAEAIAAKIMEEMSNERI